MDMYTLLYLKWITNKVLVCSMGNSAQCHGAAWMGGAFGREWIHVTCMAEFLPCSPEIMATLLISYTTIQDKKFKRKKKSLIIHPQ